jgi:hypothetical protein
MAIQLLFNRKPTQFLSVSSATLLLELDATINEDHRFNTDVTTYPIEAGAAITDHARQQPERLSIQGFITEAPVKWLGGIRNLKDQIESGRTRVQTALDALLEMSGYKTVDSEASRKDYTLNAPVQVDILTGLRFYSGMILTSLSIPRDSRTGEAMYFTAEFIKIRMVQSSTAPVLNTVDKAGTGSEGVSDQAPEQVDKGKDTTKDAKPRTKSLLKEFTSKAKQGQPFEFKAAIPEG